MSAALLNQKKLFRDLINNLDLQAHKCKVFKQIILGWRKTMEDAQIYDVHINGNISVFGVFDGHGGYAYILN